jgi:glucose-6-phosphate 1-epimerase
MQTLQLQHGDTLAEISPFGGHVLRWRCRGRERLFLSPQAVLDGSTAIRGGVPVIFPQFNARGPYPRHGFARTLLWRVLEAGAERAVLQLEDSPQTQALWPYRFRLQLTVALEVDALCLSLAVHNRDTRTFAFSAALHTYLACAADSMQVHGLQGCGFEEHGAWQPASGATALRPLPPLDRIYRGPVTPLRIEDADSALLLEVEHFSDWVLWNPGTTGAAALADLGAAAAPQFLCVEPACIFEPVTLAAEEGWRGSLRLRVLR